MNDEILQDRKVNTYLRAARLKRNLSQEDVAFANHISVSAYQNYEYMNATPSLYIASVLADYFEVKIEDIFPIETLKQDERLKRRR